MPSSAITGLTGIQSEVSGPPPIRTPIYPSVREPMNWQWAKWLNTLDTTGGGSSGTGTGDQGTTGIRGINGADGAQGLPGDDGSDGAEGSTGILGIQGVTGVVGLTGETGIRGIEAVAGMIPNAYANISDWTNETNVYADVTGVDIYLPESVNTFINASSDMRDINSQGSYYAINVDGTNILEYYFDFETEDIGSISITEPLDAGNHTIKIQARRKVSTGLNAYLWIRELNLSVFALQGSVGATGLIGSTGVGSSDLLDTTGFPTPNQPILMWDQTDEALYVASEVSAVPEWVQIGSSGKIGATGIIGLQGIQGLTGLYVQGDTGLQGIQGLTGLYIQGDTGIQGLQGLTGLYVQGDTGIQGLQGLTGLYVQGDTGIQGIQGLTGLYVQGDTGIVGPQGLTGIGGGSSTEPYQPRVVRNDAANIVPDISTTDILITKVTSDCTMSSWTGGTPFDGQLLQNRFMNYDTTFNRTVRCAPGNYILGEAFSKAELTAYKDNGSVYYWEYMGDSSQFNYLYFLSFTLPPET